MQLFYLVNVVLPSLLFANAHRHTHFKVDDVFFLFCLDWQRFLLCLILTKWNFVFLNISQQNYFNTSPHIASNETDVLVFLSRKRVFKTYDTKPKENETKLYSPPKSSVHLRFRMFTFCYGVFCAKYGLFSMLHTIIFVPQGVQQTVWATYRDTTVNLCCITIKQIALLTFSIYISSPYAINEMSLLYIDLLICYMYNRFSNSNCI